MSAASEILKHVMDENPKEMLKTLDVALMDRISSRLEEKRVEIAKQVYEKVSSDKELEDNDLANNYGDKNKITRGDVIAGAIHNAKKGRKHKKGHKK